jgi:putative FmdB family regulatory protein
MPTYEYLCHRCGPFENDRPMDESGEPGTCPACGQAAPRAFLSAPRLARMSAELRLAHATNERSVHEPRAAKRGGPRHEPNCGCRGAGGTKATRAAAKGFPGRRPWMISH